MVYCMYYKIGSIVAVIKLAEDAMDMLKRMRAGNKAERVREGKRKAKEEVSQLFET